MCAVATRPDARPSSRLPDAIGGLTPSSPSISRPDRRPTAEEFLERNWDLSDGLVSFFANEDRVKHLAGLARPGPVSDSPDKRDSNRRTGIGGRTTRSDREIGEFELLNEIASGGMGLVFKARHKRLNRIVAIKTIRTGVLRPNEETFRRLRFEAEVIASLDHPNIVPLYEVGEHRGSALSRPQAHTLRRPGAARAATARIRERRHACWHGSPGRSSMRTCTESCTAT